jgi:hypothetical protein
VESCISGSCLLTRLLREGSSWIVWELTTPFRVDEAMVYGVCGFKARSSPYLIICFV